MIVQIREAIRASGMSLGALARASGVSQPQLSRFQSGQRTLTLPAAARVCEALGLRLVGPEQPTPPESPPRPARPRKQPGKPAAGPDKPPGRARKSK